MRITRSLLLLSAAGSLLCGKFAPPSDAPVDRLIANVGEYLKHHPDDARAYYTLGRIYYLAFALDAKTLSYYQSDGLPDPINGHNPGRAARPDGGHAMLHGSQRSVYLSEALRLLKRSIELDPDNGLYLLGLACLYEDGSPSENDEQWMERATTYYLAAYTKSIGIDEKRTNRPLHGIQTLVSYEAGTSYVRLVRGRPMKKSEAATADRIEKKIAAFERLPAGPITPIVLAFRPGAALADLLAPSLLVRFNLDGTGRAQSCPWLRPDAALLVWDPEHTGRIDSGRRLFGTVTWWMFWENGYRALAALDDDHDGWLSGTELNGLAVWFDRNQNGISEPGEVVSLEQAGVLALATDANGDSGGSPMNAHGVRLKDGRVTPGWDWEVTCLESR